MADHSFRVWYTASKSITYWEFDKRWHVSRQGSLVREPAELCSKVFYHPHVIVSGKVRFQDYEASVW
jgi:hypothetical protein